MGIEVCRNAFLTSISSSVKHPPVPFLPILISLAFRGKKNGKQEFRSRCRPLVMGKLTKVWCAMLTLIVVRLVDVQTSNFFTLWNDVAPSMQGFIKCKSHECQTSFFSLNESLLSGIVCHLSSLILEVCHPSRELSITLMWINLHDIDVLCGFVTCTAHLFILIACVFFVAIVMLPVSVAYGPLSQINLN